MKYIIGHKESSFETIDIEDNIIKQIKNSTIIIVIGNESNGKLYEYYNSMYSLITNNNRLILIVVNSESKIRKQLSMLMVSYRQYDIYNINSIEQIDNEYIETIIERRASKEEVELFMGSDLIAYSDINNILLSIVDAVKNKNIGALESIVEENENIIESSLDVMDYMKKVVDSVNSGEQDLKIKSLKDTIGKLENDIEESSRQLRKANTNVEQLEADVKTITKESRIAKDKVAELEGQETSKGPIIITYSEVSTSLKKCKTQSIIYFKEITYVRYINSMVTQLLKLMQLNGLKCKLVIYDNSNHFSAIYKPITTISSAEYMVNKETILTKLEKIVLLEPNSAITSDIIETEQDVVIIYDRLKQGKEIVSGNNVYKYWVINSSNDIASIKTANKIDKQYIITMPKQKSPNKEAIAPEGLAIAEIQGYATETGAARLSKYKDLINAGSIEGKILGIIQDRANIPALIKRR